MGRRSRRRNDGALERRRELRRRSTKAEQLMWAALRNHRLGGLKFRRQHSIGPFIVDFFCVERSVVVEIDGEYHDYTEEADKRRQRFLERQGYSVIRYTNEDVLEHYEAVVLSLRKALGLPPSP